jgi:hypothetical protein
MTANLKRRIERRGEMVQDVLELHGKNKDKP